MNLKQLSAHLGLSQTTVSRALNGYPEVSETTRKRVMEAADKHNYRPNTRAKGLATGRAMAIGHVIPLSAQHEMMNPVFADFIAGAGESYSEAGYDMLLSLVADADQERAYREMAAKRNVDGLVVHAAKMRDARILLLQNTGLPFAVHGRASEITTPYNWLDVNNKSAFERATNFLLDLGHRRICLVNGQESMDFAHRRRKGYEAALAARGVEIDPALMFADEMTEIYGYDTVQRTRSLADPPTAYLASSIITAFGVRRAIEESGLKMGRDISVITHDDDLSYMRNGADVPVFTATRSSVREAGGGPGQPPGFQNQNPRAPPQTEPFLAEVTVGRPTRPPPHTVV
ncbi:substrate-binding domain-containing protein [Phaeobacter sp. HF9A]|uniref:substrate-binding domain-containing protein n=1 Tax=Phaeobacter sp. HF9A TaxID=2721561 RepID=UPI0014309E52|nr:substrate-binding domain-containing protein [Phaeobacter sp. HF9A]NIZ13787.1 LacI family DNA-binding transcriptional regulator [Phaeobacter sp. HF9A]